jgi:DNA-binding NarL/FixJ family response regulator
MAQERLTLRKTREILRLKEEAGLSNRAIARVSKVSNSTVGEYLKRAIFNRVENRLHISRTTLLTLSK